MRHPQREVHEAMTERFEKDGIIQIVPPHRFAGCLAVVTEVREWGVVGYMQLWGPAEGVVITVDDNRAWLRLQFGEIKATGGKVET